MEQSETAPPPPPGEMRNDLYITVERGEFEKGGKSVARNVEVTMLVLDSGGQTLKVSRGWAGRLRAGASGSSRARSVHLVIKRPFRRERGRAERLVQFNV